MRVRLLLLLGLAVIVAVPALARSGISVSPSSGFPATRFAVRFRAPTRTGVVGHTSRRYVVSARGPAVTWCDSSPGATIFRTRAHQTVKAILIPDARGWCRGTYHGQIQELASPACSPGHLCPEYVAVLRTVGGFRFRVR